MEIRFTDLNRLKATLIHLNSSHLQEQKTGYECIKIEQIKPDVTSFTTIVLDKEYATRYYVHGQDSGGEPDTEVLVDHTAFKDLINTLATTSSKTITLQTDIKSLKILADYTIENEVPSVKHRGALKLLTEYENNFNVTDRHESIYKTDYALLLDGNVFKKLINTAYAFTQTQKTVVNRVVLVKNGSYIYFYVANQGTAVLELKYPEFSTGKFKVCIDHSLLKTLDSVVTGYNEGEEEESVSEVTVHIEDEWIAFRGIGGYTTAKCLDIDAYTEELIKYTFSKEVKDEYQTISIRKEVNLIDIDEALKVQSPRKLEAASQIFIMDGIEPPFDLEIRVADQSSFINDIMSRVPVNLLNRDKPWHCTIYNYLTFLRAINTLKIISSLSETKRKTCTLELKATRVNENEVEILRLDLIPDSTWYSIKTTIAIIARDGYDFIDKLEL
jgi:hypothetical protein